MKHLLIAVFALLCLPAHAQTSRPTPEPVSKPTPNGEPVQLKFKDLTLTIPGTWAKQGARPMRLGTFAIPSEGDSGGAELAIYHFGPQSVDDNVQRWIQQFDEKDRKVKLTQGKSAAGPYVLVDLSGTYTMSVGRPMGGKTKAVPGQRMLGVILSLEGKGVYFLKLVGPAKTVAGQATALRASFGATAKGEVDYKKRP
jgi:hypothetical protein